MKTPLLSFFLMMMTAIALGQHKPPVAVTDYASTQAGVPVMIPILANDYCMLGHTIELFFAGQPENGTCEVMDSIIIYTPWAYFSGDDSITYIIKDVTSSLFSESGKVYINVKNDGFNWLDINNWHARINVFGNHFWDFYSASSSSSIPAASGCGTIFNSSLWIGGYDEQGGLHLAAERYRLDFWAGSLQTFSPDRSWTTSTTVLNRIPSGTGYGK